MTLITETDADYLHGKSLIKEAAGDQMTGENRQHARATEQKLPPDMRTRAVPSALISSVLTAAKD